MNPRRPALLIYCQHSLGIGHLTRSFALAAALAERFRVVFLNGGRLRRYCNSIRHPRPRSVATPCRGSIVGSCHSAPPQARQLRLSVIVFEASRMWTCPDISGGRCSCS